MCSQHNTGAQKGLWRLPLFGRLPAKRGECTIGAHCFVFCVTCALLEVVWPSGVCEEKPS